MSRHAIQFYWDGCLKVEFCPNCGLEGTDLWAIEECKPFDEEELQLSFDFSVDNKSEQS